METAALPDHMIVIADPSRHVRETIRRVLRETGIRSGLAEAEGFREALRTVRRTGARIVLLDAALAIGQPPARLRRIAEGIPGLQVIVLLNEDLPEYRQAIAERWGYSCVAKERAEAELPAAVTAILDRSPQRT